MKSTTAPIIFISALFMFFAYMISDSDAVRCYQCTTDNDKRCGDPFNATNRESTPVRQDECVAGYYAGLSNPKFVCRKIKERLSNNEIKISRMCVAEGERESDPCSPNALSTFLHVEHCSTCNTDLCNSAISVYRMTAAFFAPLTILVYKFNFL